MTSAIKHSVLWAVGFLVIIELISMNAEGANVTSDQNYQNLYRALNVKDITGKINSVKELLGVVNVKGYGAVGDGVADDTLAIQAAVDAAKLTRSVVYLPVGSYRVTSPITITANGDVFGCRLEGANAEGTKIISTLAGTTPLFKFQGGSGVFSNVGLSNMTLTVNVAGQGTGVYLDGQCFGIFDNLRIVNFNYGLWLHNQSAGASTRANQFNNIDLSYCINGIRMEQGSGGEGFHANVFNNCFFNVAANQIGFNHVSGYYTNGRFRLFMWAHDTSAIYLHAGGNADQNVGDMTYESFKVGKLTGAGRFWFSGFLRGIGGINDETSLAGASYQRGFACTNYWKSVPYGTSGLSAGPLHWPDSAYNGSAGQILSLTKPDVGAIVINTYNNSEENGLYLGRTGWQQDESAATLGMFLSSSGAVIKTYNPAGMAVVTHDNQVALRVVEGKVAIGDGMPIEKFLGATVPWDPESLITGATITTTVNIPGAAPGDLVFAGLSSVTSGKILVYASVTSADTVTVTLSNHTGTLLNLPGGTLKIGVMKN